jgi:PAS domain S-box-containing protein
MSILGLICVLLALVATLLFVLFLFQRRDLRAVSELSLTIQRAISGERLPQRIELDPSHEGQLDVQALGVSVNQLLLRASRTSGREKSGPKLFTELGERIHEAVLVHRDVILYANSQFASFVGVDRVDLIDRRLSDLVAPEYADLVGENLRRRLAGAHGAERFEVEMVGPAGAGEPARANYRADRLRRGAGTARDRRRSHSHQEAARARERQGRREGSRGAGRMVRRRCRRRHRDAAAASVRHAVAR